ncbi:LysM peptidoglycan-binding domain-containing protein [Candidatus Solirubrobacter pratensis]|uniref:LysM peptidoglycan-binding domain-containing protein n=1 Tax=Candidatus Solirubrobacter pratensis TaxID=1298857 RepID=UPI0003F913D5|nr:LysM domain-containing protein [Candidatus Solirubrobacter pratensis]
MARRSPARFLAPIALLVFAVALYTVVKDARAPAGRSSSDAPARASGTPSKSSAKKKKSSTRTRRTYTVKPGDTASGIADKTGVSITTMEKLNKNFDPQTLAPGQRIRLSE